MKMKKRTRVLSLLLAAAMLVTPMVATTAFAETLGTWSTTVGSTDKTWYFPSGKTGTISNAVSSNPSIVSVTTWTTTSVITNPVANGSANLTITYLDTAGATQTIIQPVTVGGSGAARTYNFTTIGSEQTDSQYLSSLGTVVSQNTNVATVSLNSSGYIVIRATGNGSTTITGNGLGAGGVSIPINYAVTVSAANSGTGTTGGVGSINGTVITIPRGGTYTFPSAYQMSASSGNTNVVTAVPTGTTGSITYTLNGVAVGETTVITQKMTSLSSNWDSVTYTVKVTDGTSGSTSTTGTTLAKMDLSAGGSRTYNSTYTEVDATSGKSDNESIAKVAITGKAIKITGVSAGSANITFKARLQANGTWTDFTIPVTVSGTGASLTNNGSSGSLSGNTENTSEEDTSGKITFKKDTYTLKKSGKQPYVIANGIKMGDDTVKAKELLWVSNNTSVVAVNAKTGQFKVLKTSGSARLIAVDPDGEYVGSVVIKAKK